MSTLDPIEFDEFIEYEDTETTEDELKACEDFENGEYDEELPIYMQNSEIDI